MPELIYGLDSNNFVVLGSNTYEYKNDIRIIEMIKTYKKVAFDDDFNSSVDFLPDGVEEIILGAIFNKPIENLPQTLKKLVIKKYNGIGQALFNQSLEHLPSGLETLELDYCNFYGHTNGSYCSNTILNSLNNLPPNLKNLKLQTNNRNLNINNIPDTVENLYLKEFNYIIKLPKNLKIFDVYCNDTDKLNYIQNNIKPEYPNVIFNCRGY